MPQVFKRNVLAAVPADAEIISQGGKRFAKWTDGGKSIRKPISAKGDKVLMGQSRLYYGKVQLAPGRWKTVTLFTDKTASERALNDRQKQVDRGAAGMSSAKTDRLRLPLPELVKLYVQNL